MLVSNLLLQFVTTMLRLFDLAKSNDSNFNSYCKNIALKPMSDVQLLNGKYVNLAMYAKYNGLSFLLAPPPYRLTVGTAFEVWSNSLGDDGEDELNKENVGPALVRLPASGLTIHRTIKHEFNYRGDYYMLQFEPYQHRIILDTALDLELNKNYLNYLNFATWVKACGKDMFKHDDSFEHNMHVFRRVRLDECSDYVADKKVVCSLPSLNICIVQERGHFDPMPPVHLNYELFKTISPAESSLFLQ